MLQAGEPACARHPALPARATRSSRSSRYSGNRLIRGSLIFDFYPVTAIMVVLLALLNDIPIMMIAYDNAPFARAPVRWDMIRVLTVASALGIYGVLESFVLYWIARDCLGLPPAVLKVWTYRMLGHVVPSHVRHLARIEGQVKA